MGGPVVDQGLAVCRHKGAQVTLERLFTSVEGHVTLVGRRIRKRRIAEAALEGLFTAVLA